MPKGPQIINKELHLLALQFILNKMSKSATLKAASRTFPPVLHRKETGFLGALSLICLRGGTL